MLVWGTRQTRIRHALLMCHLCVVCVSFLCLLCFTHRVLLVRMLSVCA